ncbi:hypothetical protein ACOMHN_021353 [Nucella lapillus]
MVVALLQVLAGISEQEEQGSSHEDPSPTLPLPSSTTPTPSPTPSPSPRPRGASRSLQATPEKRPRDTSRDRDVTSSSFSTPQAPPPPPPRHRRRRGHRRRSLSLPEGWLSQGDVTSSLRDGPWVTGSAGERRERRQRRHSGVVCGSWLNVASDQELRERILRLFRQGLAADDVALALSRYLRFTPTQHHDQEDDGDLSEAASADNVSREEGSWWSSPPATPSLGSSSPSASLHSLPSLTSSPSLHSAPSYQGSPSHQGSSGVSSSHEGTPRSPGQYSTRSLPRRFRARDDVSRPMSSVDDVRELSQSELSLAGGQDGGEDSPAVARARSFLEAMSLTFDPALEVDEVLEVEVFSRGGEQWVGNTHMGAARARRNTTDDGDQTERGRPQRPGFLQRMLQKRKSFHDKPAAPGSPAREDSARKDSSVSRKVSLISIFRRKSSASAEARREAEDAQHAPPIATFTRDDDIGAVTSLPSSPAPPLPGGRRTMSDSQMDPDHGDRAVRLANRSRSMGSDQDVAGGLTSRTAPQRLPSHGYIPERVRFSGEYDNVRDEGTWPVLEPPGESPWPAARFQLSPEEDGQSAEDSDPSRTAQALSCLAEQGSTSGSGDGSLTRPGPVTSLQTVTSFGAGALGSDCPAAHTSGLTAGDKPPPPHPPSHPPHPPSHPPRPGPKPSLSRQDSVTAGAADITNARHSNDSGIQHDVTLNKISAEVGQEATGGVSLRAGPSPRQERPRSDFTVRWADLLQHVRDTDVIYRRDGTRLRHTARPKSDLAEDSGEDEGVANEDDGSSGDEDLCVDNDPACGVSLSVVGAHSVCAHRQTVARASL